ncbi:threonylcarbamoyl-AMP synthase [Bacillus rossius redtenbacheri]|uniref:threonylcarbamoyl-AMP synthase n=1 Tax=Bacillus rossius redtenbacheri TaxID=93214 RepID=UPI002FDDBAEF
MCGKQLYHMCKVIPVSAAGIVSDAVSLAAQVISQGCVVAVPTDTVYGLACNAQDSHAVTKLYAIKGRNLANPVSICVGKVSDIGQWADVKHLERRLLNTLLPGPVTLVLNRSPLLNPSLNPETLKVGVRVPECSFVLQLAATCGVPLALTSANTSGDAASLQTSEFAHLWARLGAVVDAGRLGAQADRRHGSTVVDLSAEGRYQVLRAGVACAGTVRVLRAFGLVDAP